MKEDNTQWKENFIDLKNEYINTLNEKDVLVNWGKPQLEALYTSKIGYLKIEILKLQLKISALKRKIECVVAAINTQQPLDILAMELRIDQELANAETIVMTKTLEYEFAKDFLSNLSSPQRSKEIRELYRMYAKQLHPDINPNLTEEQQHLWTMVQTYYDNGNLEQLRNLKIIYENHFQSAVKTLDALTNEELQLRCAALKEGLQHLKADIAQIRSSFPFTMQENLYNDEWVKNENLNAKVELEDLVALEEQLRSEYREWLKELNNV